MYAIKQLLPKQFHPWFRKKWRQLKLLPRVGRVKFGSLRRLQPISSVFGLDRGSPIDSYYIETFLHKNSNDICGHVLEIGDPGYTNKYGGSCVTISDVLHVQPGNSKATIIGNLETGEGITEDTFDCIILTETLHVIYDFRAAIANTYLALKPGGVLLVTFPGISQISRYDMDRWGDYWRFTSLSAQRLFAEVFPAENITVEAHGNVLVAISFLHGLAVQELSQEEFDYYDPNYQLSITIRAVKPKIQS